MLVVMRAQATAQDIARVCEKIQSLGFRPHVMPGAERTAIGITGNHGPVPAAEFERSARRGRGDSGFETLQAGQPRSEAGRHGSSNPRRRCRRRRTGLDRRPLLGGKPRADPGIRARRQGSRRSALARRRLQAAHFALCLSRPGRRRPQVSRRSSRRDRPGRRDRSHRRRNVRSGGTIRRLHPDRRPQHAEFFAAAPRRARAQADPVEARHVLDAGRISDGRRIHSFGRQLPGGAVRARRPHLRRSHAQHAGPERCALP